MCLRPKKLYKVYESHPDDFSYSFHPDSRYKISEVIDLPCGHCAECERQRASEWSARCVLEAGLHAQNCVLTLTYAPEHLPTRFQQLDKSTGVVSDLSCPTGVVSRRDITLFFKRLRKIASFRYFGCAEYGAHGARPHYHVLIFGWCPSDCEFFFSRSGIDYYKSKIVEKVWGLGNILVCREVTAETARYSSLYFQKWNVLEGRVKPFLLASRRPGIGADAYKMNWLQTDKIYPPKSSSLATPRFFLKRLRSKGVNLDYVTRSRVIRRRLLKMRPSSRQRELHLSAKLRFSAIDKR